MLPLEGITVVFLEQAVAAPFATRQLADLGARVIKVERPEVGDFARSYDRTVKGLSSHFVWLNRSKESLTLDLKQKDPKEILSRLVERADVFVQNLAPGATERLDFGAKTLRERHPHLIVCDVSGYGSSGPYRDKKAYDAVRRQRSAEDRGEPRHHRPLRSLRVRRRGADLPRHPEREGMEEVLRGRARTACPSRLRTLREQLGARRKRRRAAPGDRRYPRAAFVRRSHRTPRRGKDRQRPDEERLRLPPPFPARSPGPVEGGEIPGRPSARPPASCDHGRHRAGHGPDPLHR